LLHIVGQQGTVDEAIRLLAVVIAKNAVGSSWRKTLGSREWSRVPEEEKRVVNDAAFNLLLSDSSERVATQLSLLITNIARFDFPGRSDKLLQILLTAASWDSQVPPPAKLRALKTLRSVLNGLTTKRFVIEPPAPGPGGKGMVAVSDLRQLSQQINNERELFKTRIAEVFAPLRDLFLQHCEAFLTCAPGWDLHGPFAKAAVSALTELIMLTPTPSDTIPPGTEQLLQAIHKSCGTITHAAQSPAYAALSAQDKEKWQGHGGRLYERMTRCVLALLDNYPIPFAEFVPHFLSLYVENALISLDAATVRSMRAKRRVLIVRFIAKALLNPFYRPEWASTPIPAHGTPEQHEQMRSSFQKASIAHAALSRMLSNEGGQCSLLVEAVIAKYVALTPDELEEWQVDPESYARSMDIESGPDADTPRPIGVGLLLCMLERGGEEVASALVSLAGRMQAVQPPTPETVLMREACYRCIGEGYTHVSAHINFRSWYENELAPQLAMRLPEFLSGRPDLISSVLQARALWLVGVCGQDLDAQQWCAAYQLVVQHMASVDLVVALTAVSSVLSLTAAIMEDQALMEQYAAATKPRAGMPNLMEALSIQEHAQELHQQENDGVIAETRSRVEARVAALSGSMSSALNGCFTLLKRLSEVESMVRVLQLVSVLVEVLGSRIHPHLGIIAAALPEIWEAASRHASSQGASSRSSGGDAAASDTGAVVRLHSALIAVLTHLVGKLRSVAVSNAQITSVIFPLLQYSTNLGGPESECLVEEAFRLWNTTISSMPEVTPQLLELLPNLSAILRRGKDNAAVFPILESYLLLGAAAALTPLSAMIQESLQRTIGTVTQAVLVSLSTPAPPAGAGVAAPAPSRAFPPEAAQEAMAASALADVMLQLFPQDVPTLLLSTFKAMAALLAHPAVPAQGVAVKVVNVMEGFLEVLGRLVLVNPASLSGLVEHDAEAMARFLDKWLVVASARFLEEIIGVKTMAMLGRFRRRLATTSLCAVIMADACPAVYDPKKLTRICALAVQAVVDDAEFHADQADLDVLDFKNDLSEDFVLAKRLQVTRADIIRTVNLPETVRTAVHKLSSHVGGEAALVELMSQHSTPRLVSQLGDVMRGVLQFTDSGDEELLMGREVLPTRDGSM